MIKVRNPRNGNFDYELIEDSAEEILAKSVELRKNQKTWNEKGIEHRVEVLTEFVNRLEGIKEELIQQLSIDTGRRKISEIEIDGVLGLIKRRCFSSPALIEAPEEKASLSNPNVLIQQQLVPYQLVGAISPWNFPLLLAMMDTVPALLAGSTVLLKPSEVTPRFMDPLENVLKSMPELKKVFQLVRGGVDAGKAVVDCVDAVCFTGSVPTGQKIGQRCAERFIPAFLELGGKDAAIILADANLEATADAILRSAAGVTGQACQSLERVYVDEFIFDKFLETLLNKILPLKFNHDYEKGGTLGPIIHDKQAEKIQNQLDDALAKGAEIMIGGEIKNIKGGLWMLPTVLVGVNHDMDVMKEETFGPVIPMMKYSDINEAIKLANDSDFGLSASVFSSDTKNAIAVASQIDAGGISINDGSLTNQVYDATKNSFKLSGLNGSRMGEDGFTRFFRKKAFFIQTAAPQSIRSQDEIPYTEDN